jgi:ParB family transcriptional regulator, chromosome partitioning protein
MTTDTAETYEVGTTHHVPPGSLLLERNIREAKPDEDLVRSVGAIGVLEPIVAVNTPEGQLLVRHGQRRTLAAVEAGVETVPVYVTGVDELTDSAEVDRIIRQRDENTHRAGLTTAEEIGVVAQLAAFGMSPDEIAEQARIAKDRVQTALTVTDSKMARKAAEKWNELSLDQAAAIAEFEDDKDAVTALVEASRNGGFEHTAQRLRDDRKEAEAKAACVAQLEADGVTVLTEAPSYNARTTRLDDLVDAKGKGITPATHKDCPGNVAWASFRWKGNERTYVPAFGCSDPVKHGHRDRYSSSPAKPAAADMTAEEREKAKAQRRLVIDNNKAWASAEAVRRQWLAAWSKIKTPPKGAAAFIAVSNSRDSVQFDFDIRPGQLAADWLGITHNAGGRFDLTKAVEKTTEPRALVIALVYNLAIYEAHLTQQSWREDGTTSAAGRYLRFLASCGYTLSEVEQYAVSKKRV